MEADGRRGRHAAEAFGWGVPIGTLGGLIGLGGAEFRLPVLVERLGYSPRSAVPMNLGISLLTLAAALVIRARTLSLVGARWRRLIEGVLEAGRQQGEFGVSGPHMARVISSMVAGVAEASRCFGTVESPAPSPEELWSALVAFLDRGVLAPQGEAQ